MLKGKNLNTFLGLLPAFLFLAAIFIWPVLKFVTISFYPDETFSMDNYQTIIDPDRPYLEIMTDTFRISILTALACLVIGYPYAVAIYRATKRWQKTLLIGFVLLPFWTSLLVRTLAFMQLLQNTGIVNNTLIKVSLIADPVQMVRNELGVIIGMSYMLLPFFVLPLNGVMQRIDPKIELNARSLGANRFQAFLATILPLSLPGVVVGLTIVFLLSLGFYVTPVMLGGGNVPMISSIIARQFDKTLNYSFASALSVVLILATMVFGLVLWGLSKLLEKFTAYQATEEVA